MWVWVAHERGRELMGELPPGVDVIVADAEVADLDALADQLSGVEFWVPQFLASAVSAEVIKGMRNLAVVQLLTAGVDAWLGRLPNQVTLCDARGVHSSSTAEWTVAAILSHLRDFPFFARAQGRGEWAYHATDELAGKRVLIVGAGAIGEAIASRLEPFEVSLVRVASQARAGVQQCGRTARAAAGGGRGGTQRATDLGHHRTGRQGLPCRDARRCAAGQRGSRPGGRHRGADR